MQDPTVSVTETVNTFNTFSVEIRSRIESLVKQVLIVSGGIQTITISAFLGGASPLLPEATIELLKISWILLSASIVLCLLFLLFQVIALINVGFKQKAKIETDREGVEVMNAWLPLRIINWVTGLGAFIFCVSGVVAISKAAISFIS